MCRRWPVLLECSVALAIDVARPQNAKGEPITPRVLVAVDCAVASRYANGAKRDRLKIGVTAQTVSRVVKGKRCAAAY